MFHFFSRIFKAKNTSTDSKYYVPPSLQDWSLTTIIDYWKTIDLQLNTPASDDLIQSTQQELGYNFPEDFINFHKQFDGFKDWDLIGTWFSIWPLEMIVDEYKKDSDKNFIPFCDFAIHCHWLGYVRDKHGIFKNYDQTAPIAETFEETIQLIMQNSRVLY